jgi:hypothetical protein
MRLGIFGMLLAGMAHAVEPSILDSYLRAVAQTKQAPAEVVAAAAEYVDAARALNGAGLVFEARLRMLESPEQADAIAAALDAHMKRLDERRAALLADTVRRLCEKLGAAFEQSVEAWHAATVNAPRPRAAR